MPNLPWDPEVETPCTIAIIGAGPVGVEAAIYARFLGYDVMLFDIGRPGKNVKRWHQRSMGASVGKLTTSLGWAALSAQCEQTLAPKLDQVWTGAEFTAEYVTPLAKTDLLYDHVYFNTRVVDVSRLSYHRDETVDSQVRCDDEFCLTLDSRNRGAYCVRADIIIDARGDCGVIAGFAPGGGFAIGQTPLHQHLLLDLPADAAFRQRDFESKTFLIAGVNDQTKRFALEFADLDWNDANTRLIWLVRPLEQSVAREFLEAGNVRTIQIVAAYGITELAYKDEKWLAKILGVDDSIVQLQVDCLVGNRLQRFDASIVSALQVESKAGNVKLVGGSTCATDEPHYYVLPRVGDDFGQTGLLAQYAAIRELFGLLGGRFDLDLYAIIAARGE